MLKLRDLLDREVERHEHEWMETMQRLTINGEKAGDHPQSGCCTGLPVDSGPASELDAEGCLVEDFVHGT